jgi:hypothetical protein
LIALQGLLQLCEVANGPDCVHHTLLAVFQYCREAVTGTDAVDAATASAAAAANVAFSATPVATVAAAVQEKEYLFSMLVWHERLLYGSSSSSSSSSDHQTAMQQISERLSHLGQNMRSLMGRKA